jgi:hypothetical protein
MNQTDKQRAWVFRKKKRTCKFGKVELKVETLRWRSGTCDRCRFPRDSNFTRIAGRFSTMLRPTAGSATELSSGPSNKVCDKGFPDKKSVLSCGMPVMNWKDDKACSLWWLTSRRRRLGRWWPNGCSVVMAPSDRLRCTRYGLLLETVHTQVLVLCHSFFTSFVTFFHPLT